MRCPKCRSEVGNQPVCPYCGGTIYISDTTWQMDALRQSITPVNGAYNPMGNRAMESRIRNLEMKVNLVLILLGGNFMLAILVLIALLLK